MGIFGRAQSGRKIGDDKENQAAFRRLQNDIQLMEADFKKLGKERDDALSMKAQLAKELSLLSTHMRENEKIIAAKNRAYAILEADLKRKKKESQNQPR